MNHPERAVAALERAMNSGTVPERLVRDLLGFKSADVRPISKFLGHNDPEMRKIAAKAVGKFGPIDDLIEAVIREGDSTVLVVMLKSLRGKEGLQSLAYLLNSENHMVKEEAIDMFKLSPDKDCLMLLTFDEDGDLVRRAKRYLKYD